MEAKQKAAEMYKKDYKKWRDYKRQVYEEATRDKKKQKSKHMRSSTKWRGYDSPSKDFYEDKIKPIRMCTPHAIDLTGVDHAHTRRSQSETTFPSSL